MHIYIYIYVYLCVCVVGGWGLEGCRGRRSTHVPASKSNGSGGHMGGAWLPLFSLSLLFLALTSNPWRMSRGRSRAMSFLFCAVVKPSEETQPVDKEHRTVAILGMVGGQSSRTQST